MSKMSKATLENKCEILEQINKRLLKENQELKKQLSEVGGRKAFNNKEVIKEMYHLYLNGLSLKDIANTLNEKNVKTAIGKDWGKSSIALILKKDSNKDIIGDKLFNDVINKMNSKKPNIEKR